MAFLSLPALAQNSPATTSVRIVGTVDRLDGSSLTVNTKNGEAVAVALRPDAAIFGMEGRTVADIKPGDFIASGGVKSSDGKIHAVEVRIFSEAMRGVGEGQRPWSGKPGGLMTNATVGTVSQSPEGGVVHVSYGGGESELTIGPEVPVLAYVAGDRSLLTPGAAVVTVAQRGADGTLTTGRVTAEKNGVKPPT